MSPRAVNRSRLPTTGTCYTCLVHGNLGVDVVILTSRTGKVMQVDGVVGYRITEEAHVYCPYPDCEEKAYLTARAPQARDMMKDVNWNQGQLPRRRKDDVKRAEPSGYGPEPISHPAEAGRGVGQEEHHRAEARG